MVLGVVLAMMVAAAPAQAIKGGVPDAGAHPYVGQLLFYDPTAVDPRSTTLAAGSTARARWSARRSWSPPGTAPSAPG
jgi:hypothetical protein